MHLRVTCLLAIVGIIGLSGLSSVLFAQDASKAAKAPQAPAAGKPFEGTLTLGDKTYKLQHVVVYRLKVFDDEGIAVLASEKPIPLDKLKNALRNGRGSDDAFSLFQPHTKVTFSKEGKPRFSNSFGDNFSLSVSGPNLTGELTVKNARARGTIHLDPEDGKGAKGSFDARFDVAMLDVPPPPPETKPAKDEKPMSKPADRESKAAPAVGAVNVYDLPMPKDASQVEYKKLVEHIGYQSASDVKSLVAFLSQKLAEQGWKKPDSDLVTPKSAILKRERGEANLTIFVKPSGAGSKVTIMSSGLSWEESKSKNP